MIVTILYRLEGTPGEGANTFSDVAAGKYYTDAVAWAAENEIVSGYGDGKFGPEDAITREQMAVILMNYAKFKGYDVSMSTDLSKYTDEGSISSWAKDAISWPTPLALNGRQREAYPAVMPSGASRGNLAALHREFREVIPFRLPSKT
jgi:hypothetical protein